MPVRPVVRPARTPFRRPARPTAAARVEAAVAIAKQCAAPMARFHFMAALAACEEPAQVWAVLAAARGMLAKGTDEVGPAFRAIGEAGLKRIAALAAQADRGARPA